MIEKQEAPGSTPTFPAGDPDDGPLVRRMGATIITGLSLVIALVYTWIAFAMPGGSAAVPGAGTWPRIVGIGWIAISVFALFESFKRVQLGPQDRLPTGDTFKLVLKFFVATVLYVITIPIAGSYIASSAYAIYTIVVMRSRWSVKSVLVGLAFGIASSFIFVELLDVRLPSLPW